MQFQVATQYAISILQYLHLHSKNAPNATTISAAVGMTVPSFQGVACQLKRHGLLNAVQGRHGGYMLAKPATEISVYDIFLAVEGDLQINRCLKDKQYCNRGAIDKCSTPDYFLSLQNDIIMSMSNKYVTDFSQ